MEVFPMQDKQDSKYFDFMQEDVAIVGSMEGGYDITRPRTTRKPRRIFTTGFTHITELRRHILESFYNEHGKYKSFLWTNPVSLEEMTVRIVEWPKAKYVGIGGYHVWDWSGIKLKEV